MLNTDRNYKNFLSYLYIIQLNGGIEGKFFDMLFHFNRINNEYHSEKMSKDFIYTQHQLVDRESPETLRTLTYYGFIDESNTLTAEGEAYLTYELNHNSWLMEATELFRSHYNGEYASENTTLKNYENISVNCFYKNYSM